MNISLAAWYLPGVHQNAAWRLLRGGLATACAALRRDDMARSGARQQRAGDITLLSV